MIIEIIKSILGIGTLSIQGLAYNVFCVTNVFIPRKSYGNYLNRANLLEEKLQVALSLIVR